jgi:hypothetical protein
MNDPQNYVVSIDVSQPAKREFTADALSAMERQRFPQDNSLGRMDL